MSSDISMYNKQIAGDEIHGSEVTDKQIVINTYEKAKTLSRRGNFLMPQKKGEESELSGGCCTITNYTGQRKKIFTDY